MHIGILTLPLHTNYGGILQAYALQTVLERQGHKVELICKPHLKKEPRLRDYISRYINKYLRRIPTDIFYEKNCNDLLRTIRKNTQSFIETRIHCNYYDSLFEIPQAEYDTIIVGSDQVWRYDFRTCFQGIENAYLEFAKNWKIKRIAYAASFGLETWNYSIESTDKCRTLIKQFDAISVREIDGINFCQSKFESNADLVLDPTFLLSKDYYLSLMPKESLYEEVGSLFYYFLDEDPLQKRLISIICDSLGIASFTVNSRCEDSSAPIKERIHPPIEEWLCGISKSKMIITDSFHGCVFSIIFQKPFWVIKNESGGNSRIYSLLSLLGLEDRLITSLISEVDYGKDIDWDSVNKRLLILREKSLYFLQKNI